MRYLQAFCLGAAMTLASVSNAVAQGDSDPGFTQVGAMRWGSGAVITEDEYEFQRAQFSVGHTFSMGEKDVKYHIPQLEVRVPVMETGYIDVRLPIVSASGDLFKKWGMGDLTVAYTHVIKADPYAWTVQGTGGVMFGMTTANGTDNASRPLPMSYQSGLGSTDVMLGFSAQFKEYLNIAVGYQQPIFRYNENDYFRSSYINDPVYNNSDYVISRKLYRNGDVMMRLEGRYATNRIGFSAGPLAIYHLADDLYQDRMGYWNKIDGTQGFTLSGVGNVFLRFGRYGSFKLDVTGSLPFIKRDIRADGLERQYTIMPRFTFFFGQRTLLF